MTHPSFSVNLGKCARSIEYRDTGGRLEFFFDARGGTSLVLEHFGPREPSPSNYDVGFQRAKAFLRAQGYTVGEYGVATPCLPSDDEVLAVLHDALHAPARSELSLIAPPRRAQFKDDTDGFDWSLWIVAELAAGARRGHHLLFDPLSKQFGVASPTNLFLGFWGSFDETVAALLAI